MVSTDSWKDAVSSEPLATSNTDGAEILIMLYVSVEATNKLNTATIISSMPCRFPWLSNIGTVIMILKLALGLRLCELLLGSRYGSAGATTTELAKIVSGGKLKVLHAALLVSAVAIVVRSVVKAVAIFSQPLPMD